MWVFDRMNGMKNSEKNHTDPDVSIHPDDKILRQAITCEIRLIYPGARVDGN